MTFIGTSFALLCTAGVWFAVPVSLLVFLNVPVSLEVELPTAIGDVPVQVEVVGRIRKQ